MKVKILSIILLAAVCFTACKQTPKTVEDVKTETKTVAKKANNKTNKTVAKGKKEVANSNKKADNIARKTRNAAKQKAANAKKVASKKINTNKAKLNNTTKPKTQNRNIASLKNSSGQINSPTYYAQLKKHLKLDDNKMRGVEGINKAFDNKIAAMPKIKGKPNMETIKTINLQRASSLKRFLTDEVYKRKLAFDVKYSKKK